MTRDYRNITRASLLKAIAEADEVGRVAFREHYGFGASTNYELEHEGARYDSFRHSSPPHTESSIRTKRR